MLSTLFRTLVALCLLSLATFALAQDARPFTPADLRAALKRRPSGMAAAQLADQVRALFGADQLKGGPNARVQETPEGLLAAFAVEAPNVRSVPLVTFEVAAPGNVTPPVLQRLGSTDVYAAVIPVPEGFAGRFRYETELPGLKTDTRQFEAYRQHPDSREQPNVPKGKLTQMPPWKSKVFEGTTRDWWVYVPATYRDDRPACVMVFQDGQSYKDFVSTVFDNLIAKGDIPVTVGIFINPGTLEGGRSNRAFEYDTLSDAYVRMLLEEILPEVEKTTKLRQDPDSRAIAGISSGGICAFTAAWERPDAFRKVLSWVGSYTSIAARLDDKGKLIQPGGNNYPSLIRKTDKKPLRIFLQDGENDLDNVHGSWPLANHEMDRALAFKKYDYKFVMGNGFHSMDHGRALLPDSLRWLWRDYKP